MEEVNAQFRDPELTTFVCVCIPEFLSLYETERLVQELAKFEIDSHNIVINQVPLTSQSPRPCLCRASDVSLMHVRAAFLLLPTGMTLNCAGRISRAGCGPPAWLPLRPGPPLHFNSIAPSCRTMQLSRRLSAVRIADYTCGCAVGSSKLLAARVRMQQKYLDQFYDLYEDFHIVKLPLLEEEVRGLDSLKQFSANLIQPYQPAPAPSTDDRCVLQCCTGPLT